MELWKLFGFSNYLQNKQIKDQLSADNNKPKCPHCGGAVEPGYSRCKNCAQEIAWERGGPQKTPSPYNMISGTLSETANESSRSGVEKLRKELLRLHESGEDELTGEINEGVLQLAYRINLEEEYQWDEYGVTIHQLLDLQYDESLAPDAALWNAEISFRESTDLT